MYEEETNYEPFYAEGYNYYYDNSYIGYAPSYIGITPLFDVYVNNLAEFRDAIVGAQPNMPITINLTNHIAFGGGNPGAGVGGTGTGAGDSAIGNDVGAGRGGNTAPFICFYTLK